MALNLSVDGIGTSSIEVVDSDDEENLCKRKVRTKRGIARILSADKNINNQVPDKAKIYTSRVNIYRALQKKMDEEITLNPNEDYDSKSETTMDNIDCSIKKSKICLTPSESSVSMPVDTKTSPSSPPSPPPLLSEYRPKRKTRALMRKIEQLKAGFANSKACNSLQFVEEPEEAIEENLNKDFIVKVRWKAEILKIQIKKFERFSRLFSKMTDLTGIPVSQLFFTLNDSIIEANDTPHGIGLHISDIIDCEEVPPKENIKDVKTITLKLQSEGRKTEEVIKTNKLDPLSKVIEKYAEKRGLDPEKLILKFDGEILDPSETPTELELDDDFCIDVIIQI